MRGLALFLLFLLCLGCASGHCRKPKEIRPQAAGIPEGGRLTQEASVSEKKEKIFVYKYDGSLQCNMGKPVPLQEMAQELKGIPIFSMEKRQDGMMHIQVCGSITGQANVYEIAAQDKAEAEKRGFRLWTF